MRYLREPRPAAPRTLGLAILAAVALASCGPSPSITVQLADGALDVLLGGSATTQLSVSRAGGASADVTLDAAGAPDWVTVTFAPATLSGGATTSTVTLATDADDPDAAPTSFTLTVTAVGSGLEASDEVTVNVELLAVTGRVTDYFGQPMTGVSVAVDAGAPVPVGADGTFTVADVEVPYDLTLLDLTNHYAHVYEGLTTTDLEILGSMTPLAARQAGVTGELSEPVGTDQLALVCIEGTEVTVLGCTSVPPSQTAFAITANWYGDIQVSGNVRAWVVDLDQSGSTTGFAREGQAAIDLVDTVGATADVTLGPGPAAKTVEVTITPPPGLFLIQSFVSYRYSEHGSITFPVILPPGTDVYEAVLPDVPGATASLLGIATNLVGQVGYAWEVGEYSSGTLDLVMPRGFTKLSPEAGATDVNTSTVFSVRNYSDGPVTFLFSGDPYIAVTTSEPETTIPDLASLGLGLPSGANYTWQVMVMPRLATVDEVAHGGLVLLNSALSTLTGGPGPSSSGAVVVDSGSPFTTE